MTKSFTDGKTVSHVQQQSATGLAAMLGDLYWFIQVVEAGSFSAAAERNGIAKSSLSRRVAQLERQLQVQLLNRSTRLFAITTAGEQIYRYALDMLAAAEAALNFAQDSNDMPGGLLRLSTSSILSGWTLELLASFRQQHPAVQFALTLQDTAVDIASQRLDLALSLNEVPKDSNAIVARPITQLEMGLIAAPSLLAELGQPRRLAKVSDNHLLVLGSPPTAQPWPLRDGIRKVHAPALSAENTHTLMQAACAGLGIACLPLCTCQAELAAGTLQIACPDEALTPVTLYALTPPYKGITNTARQLIAHINQMLGTHAGAEATLQPF
ncbi:MAG: LysR family transcriptional regulator [Pseudomonas sp.]